MRKEFVENSYGIIKSWLRMLKDAGIATGHRARVKDRREARRVLSRWYEYYSKRTYPMAYAVVGAHIRCSHPAVLIDTEQCAICAGDAKEYEKKNKRK